MTCARNFTPQWPALTGLALALTAGPAPACEVKLLLTWDVSASMSAQEYRMQREGTVRALLDPEVLGTISTLPGGIALSVMQWAGPGEQEISIPWTVLGSRDAVAGFALQVGALRDPFETFRGTAVGDSLRLARAHMAAGPECDRSVIDISADGGANAGSPARLEADALAAEGVSVNALVLPASELALAAEGDPYLFYVNEVARARGAFVMDVDSYDDYWLALKRKLLRELPMYVARN